MVDEFAETEKGTLESFRKAFQGDPNRILDINGLSLIESAVLSLRKGHDEGLDIARFLLLEGADPNLRDRGRFHRTPLACFYYNVWRPTPGQLTEVTRMMLAAGADPNARDDRGGSCLSYLLMNVRLDDSQIAPALDMLLAAGADPLQRGRWGQTPLALADTAPWRQASARRMEAELARQGRLGEDPGVGLPDESGSFRPYRGGDRVLGQDEPSPVNQKR